MCVCPNESIGTLKFINRRHNAIRDFARSGSATTFRVAETDRKGSATRSRVQHRVCVCAGGGGWLSTCEIEKLCSHRLRKPMGADIRRQFEIGWKGDSDVRHWIDDRFPIISVVGFEWKFRLRISVVRFLQRVTFSLLKAFAYRLWIQHKHTAFSKVYGSINLSALAPHFMYHLDTYIQSIKY